MSENNHYQVIMGSYTVQEFVDEIDAAYDENGKETGKGILVAPFQRHYKWHIGDNPLYLLDSLNRNIFVMPVILVEFKKQTWIIDGQQRLATLYCYSENCKPRSKKPVAWKDLIINIKNKNKNKGYMDCEWRDFEGKLFNKPNIMDTPIGYSFLFNINHEDNKPLLVSIFDRINNQGMDLTTRETVDAYAFLDEEVLTKLLKILDAYQDDNKFLLYRCLSYIYVQHTQKQYSYDKDYYQIQFAINIVEKSQSLDNHFFERLNKFLDVYSKTIKDKLKSFYVSHISYFSDDMSIISTNNIEDISNYHTEKENFEENIDCYIIIPLLQSYLVDELIEGFKGNDVVDITLHSKNYEFFIYDYLNQIAESSISITETQGIIKLFAGNLEDLLRSFAEENYDR